MNLADRVTAFYESLNTLGPKALDQMADLFAEDIHYISPVEERKSLTEIRGGYERLFKQYPHVRFEDIALRGDDDQFEGTMTMVLRPRVGPAFTVQMANVFRGQGGKVVYQRDYWDLLGSIMDVIPLVGPVYKRVVQMIFA